MIPSHVLDAIRAVPLPPLAREYLTLRRSGQGREVAQCPFHKERTASFTVYLDHFHCFGCGKSGDAITFLRDMQGVSYIEAVKYLADRNGISLEPVSRRAAAAQVIAQKAEQQQAEFMAWWWKRRRLEPLQQMVYDALAETEAAEEWVIACGRDGEAARQPHEEWTETVGRLWQHWRTADPMERHATFTKLVSVRDRKEWESHQREEREFVETFMGLAKEAWA
jgi:acylphosphatase